MNRVILNEKEHPMPHLIVEWLSCIESSSYYVNFNLKILIVARIVRVWPYLREFFVSDLHVFSPPALY